MGPMPSTVSAAPIVPNTTSAAPPIPSTTSGVPLVPTFCGAEILTGTTRPATPNENASLLFTESEKVQVWSVSQGAWLEGIIKDIFTIDTTYDNYAVPAGVIKVEFKNGIKFIKPEQVNTMLRKSLSMGR